MAAIILSELGSTPVNPPSDYVKVYAKTDTNLYKLDDAGNEEQITGFVATASNFTNDNRLVRTDTVSGVKSIQQSGVTLDDSDNVTIPGNILQSGTGYIDVAAGTTAQRPGSPDNGMIRYNSTDNKFEFYENGSWTNYATSGGTVSTLQDAYDNGSASPNEIIIDSTRGDVTFQNVATDTTNTGYVLTVANHAGADTFHVTGGGKIIATGGLELSGSAITGAGNIIASGNITVTGTVDGLNVDGDLLKVDGTIASTGDQSFNSTGFTKIASGTTAQRVGTTNGELRYNSTTSKLEGYQNGAWVNLGGEGTITGSGVTNQVAKFSSSTALTSSNITDDGSTITLTTNTQISGTTQTADNVGINAAPNTGRHLTIAAGTTAKSQIFFTSSTDKTTPINGDLWYNGTNLYFYDGSSNVDLLAGGGVSDHGASTGLTDDDHTQYALLAGRAGGQTLIGGTASGDDLTLQSTSNATKGTIIFGAAGSSGYDEVNDRLGIGTTSPSFDVHVRCDNASAYSSSATNTHICTFVENQTSGGYAAHEFAHVYGGQTGYSTIGSYQPTSGSKDTTVFIGARENSGGTTPAIVHINNSKTEILKGALEVKNGIDFRLWDSGDSHYVGFKAPALTATQVWTLPTADGSANQVLQTNGSGTLSWATAGGGGVIVGTHEITAQAYNGTTDYTFTATVTGAAVGDAVSVNPSKDMFDTTKLDSQDITLWGFVDAANSVKIRMRFDSYSDFTSNTAAERTLIIGVMEA